MGCCFSDNENEKEYLITTRYDGEKNWMKEHHGYGVNYYENGDIYDGEWKHDKKQGYGTLTKRDGKV